MGKRWIHCGLVLAVLTLSDPIGVTVRAAEFPSTALGVGTYVEREVGATGAGRVVGLYQPPAWRSGGPAIVMLHGFGGSAEDARLYGMEHVADREGVMIAYASGPHGEWNIGANYRNASNEVQHRDDVGYLDQIIDYLTDSAGSKASTVYLVGNSMGGLMAVSYACQRSTRVAGIAAVISGMTSGQIAVCSPGNPIPFTLMIGSADKQLPPFEGRKYAVSGVDGSQLWLASFDEALAFWARANGCGPNPKDTEMPRRNPGDETSLLKREFSSCGAAPVVGYVFRGMGHRWPGMMRHPKEALDPSLTEKLGLPSSQADGSELIWSFFESAQSAAP